jgi:hypothetical protein
MAQHDYIISNATFPAVRTDINNALSAIQTTNSGTSRPTGAVSGQLWLDTTSATTPTLKYYDGADDISLATIDHTANTVNWLDSTVSITGLSTTATGTVLTLSDTANTSTVNLIIDNQKEIRFRETTANGTNYVGLKAPASLSADLTFTLPSADGTSGQALITNGSGVLSFASAGTSWQSVQTTGFTAVAGRGYPCNTTSSAFTVTLPASATVGDTISILDYAGTFDTNALTISPNGLKLEGSTSSQKLTGDREGITLVYVDSTQGWIALSGTQEGTDGLEPPVYSVDMLVVAGGGAGGQSGDNGAGGGGAGGLRTSTQNFTIGSVYTITVGSGGAKGTAGSSTTTGQGGNGGDSSVSGSGITTITSTGGGGGGAGGANNTSGQAGKSGGSGGGTGAYGTNVGGAGNTPSTSPSQGNNGGHMVGQPYNGGAGGGGANAVGENATTNLNAGAGGNGTASSITGSSVTYSGGGGGGVANPNPTKPIAGGTGGGGAGAVEGGASAVAGTANTGGAGGGGYGTTDKAGAGGSGVVILRMLTASYSGTTTGSPTVTTDGSYKVLKFTGSGSYTA